MTFESLLEDAGGFGLYQKLMSFVFLLSAMCTAGLSYWTQIFILLIPSHTCRMPGNSTGLLNVIDRDSCHLFVSGDNSSELNSTVRTIQCESGWDYDYEVLFPTMSTENNWVCNESWRSYFTHTIFWIGSVTGFFLSGIISDKYGRRSVLIILEILCAISNVASMFMPGHLAFSVARFLTGITVMTSSTIAFLVTIEYTGIKQRTMIGMLQGVGWTITAAIAPWVMYYVRSWRVMLIVCTVPNILMVFVLWWVPESASWLLTRGRKEEAIKILNRIAAVNKKSLPPDYFSKKLEIKAATETEEDVDSKEVISSIIKVAKTKNLRKNIALLLILWFMVSLCYNGNTLETINLNVNLYLAFSVGALVELAGNLLFWVSAENLGRRWANFLCNVLGTVFAISILAIPNDQPLVEFAYAMILRMVYACAYDVTLQYGTELLPTSIRGRGVGIQLMIGDLGNSVAPSIVYLNYFDFHYPLLAFGLISIGSAIIALLLPETANQPLPQTIEDGRTFGTGQSFFLCPFREKKREKESIEMNNLETIN